MTRRIVGAFVDFKDNLLSEFCHVLLTNSRLSSGFRFADGPFNLSGIWVALRRTFDFA